MAILVQCAESTSRTHFIEAIIFEVLLKGKITAFIRRALAPMSYGNEDFEGREVFNGERHPLSQIQTPLQSPEFPIPWTQS